MCHAHRHHAHGPRNDSTCSGRHFLSRAPAPYEERRQDSLREFRSQRNINLRGSAIPRRHSRAGNPEIDRRKVAIVLGANSNWVHGFVAGAYAGRSKPLPTKKEVSAPSVLFFFFLLFVFVFLTAYVGEALVKRSLGAEIGRQAGVVFAEAEEPLARAASVRAGRELHARTHAVNQ